MTGALLALAQAHARADTNFISQFNTASDVDAWYFDFGSVTHTNWFDPTMDGNTNPASGSMGVTLGFNTVYAGDNKGAYSIALSTPIANNDVLNLDTIHLDLKIDPASAMDAFGNNGYFALVLRTGLTWFWAPQFADNVGANYHVDPNGWRHIDQAITLTSTDAVHHISWQLYGGPSQNINGDVTLWIDNLYLTTLTTTTSPPPVMTLARTVPGLNITASVLGGTYQRQDIRTATGNYSWINPSNGPVTYSFTITNFPSGPTNGFETRLLLVGDHFAPGAFADYNEPNVVYLRIHNVGNHYDAELRYKVNKPNFSIFDTNLVFNPVATLTGPSPLGTWGLTLAGTNVTLFGPPGTTNAAFGPEVLTNFEAYTYPYIGIVPNDDANIGQSATFSAVSVSGATTALDEHFNSLTKWYKGVAQDPTGVLLQPSNTFAKVFWPPPTAPTFSLHATNVLDASAPSWPPAGLTANTVGTNKVALLPVPTNSVTFLRLETP